LNLVFTILLVTICPQNFSLANSSSEKWWQTILKSEISWSQWEGLARTQWACFFILGVWVGHSQVDSHFGNSSPKFSENNLRVQNSLDWRLPYTIEQLLRCWCLKWACIIHLSIYNISYDQKKGQEWNCQFDSQPLKVRNLFQLRVCRWCATYCWKFLDKGCNFSLDLISIGVLHKKLWASKMTRIPILGISGLSTWESWGKWHLGASLVANQKKIL
jgi:hypothetical protein